MYLLIDSVGRGRIGQTNQKSPFLYSYSLQSIHRLDHYNIIFRSVHMCLCLSGNLAMAICSNTLQIKVSKVKENQSCE